MCVYLLHFSEPFTGQQRNAAAKRIQTVQHYVGYTNDLESRIEAHASGTGARLTQVIREAGLTFTLACVWQGAPRETERKIKRQKHTARYCPICNDKGD